MNYNVENLDMNYSFEINGASYIGEPRDGTMLFVTSKVKHLLSKLSGHKNCLVFAETGMEISDEIKAQNCFLLSDNPQLAYAKFAKEIEQLEKEKYGKRKYTFTSDGYYVGENVVIGEGAIIEPMAMIDHDVCIGKNAHVGAGSIIRNAVIGDDFSCKERTIIGSDSFFFAETKDEEFRIPSFGLVKIGNHVDLGAQTVIERGFNSHTVLSDYVMIDSNVAIGHDDVIGEHVTITAGATLAGLVTVGHHTYIGLNATVKQRIKIGANSLVGMGAVVITNVKDNIKVFGNPAKKFGM